MGWIATPPARIRFAYPASAKVQDKLCRVIPEKYPKAKPLFYIVTPIVVNVGEDRSSDSNALRRVYYSRHRVGDFLSNDPQGRCARIVWGLTLISLDFDSSKLLTILLFLEVYW